jgi:signal transduction histidine kinase
MVGRLVGVNARLAQRASDSWRTLAITFVVELIAVAGTLGETHQPQAVHVDSVGTVLIAASAAMVLLSRVRPWVAFPAALAGTAAYLAIGYPTDSPFFLGFLVTAYRVPMSGMRARSVALGLISVGGLVLAGWFSPNPANGWLALATLISVALVVGQATADLQARSDDRERRRREEETARRLADERINIARELHDVVSHSIAMINVQAGVALHVISDRPEQAREALVAIKAASGDAMRDIRSILGLLRDTAASRPRQPAPGLAQLPGLIETIRRVGIPVTAKVDLAVELPGTVDVTAYRVVREALTNVVRHAPGSSVRISIRREAPGVMIEVENGAAPHAGAHEARTGAGLGLAGMEERVQAVRGSLEAGPTTSGGFRVIARFPLPGAG